MGTEILKTDYPNNEYPTAQNIQDFAGSRIGDILPRRHDGELNNGGYDLGSAEIPYDTIFVKKLVGAAGNQITESDLTGVGAVNVGIGNIKRSIVYPRDFDTAHTATQEIIINPTEGASGMYVEITGACFLFWILLYSGDFDNFGNWRIPNQENLTEFVLKSRNRFRGSLDGYIQEYIKNTTLRFYTPQKILKITISKKRVFKMFGFFKYRPFPSPNTNPNSFNMYNAAVTKAVTITDVNNNLLASVGASNNGLIVSDNMLLWNPPQTSISSTNIDGIIESTANVFGFSDSGSPVGLISAPINNYSRGWYDPAPTIIANKDYPLLKITEV